MIPVHQLHQPSDNITAKLYETIPNFFHSSLPWFYQTVPTWAPHSLGTNILSQSPYLRPPSSEGQLMSIRVRKSSYLHHMLFDCSSSLWNWHFICSYWSLGSVSVGFWLSLSKSELRLDQEIPLSHWGNILHHNWPNINVIGNRTGLCIYSLSNLQKAFTLFCSCVAGTACLIQSFILCVTHRYFHLFRPEIHPNSREAHYNSLN